MADASVRPARVADVAAVADLQLRCWRTAYAQILPPAALATLRDADAEARWREAVVNPPSPQHRLLVALAADRLVGFTALGPGQDADLDPDRTGEVYVLMVEPGSRGAGHGSRLLAAAVDHLREDGCTTAYVWLFAADAVTQEFFEAAGWAADGASRDLDMGQLVPELRLHTDLTG